MRSPSLGHRQRTAVQQHDRTSLALPLSLRSQLQSARQLQPTRSLLRIRQQRMPNLLRVPKRHAAQPHLRSLRLALK